MNIVHRTTLGRMWNNSFSNRKSRKYRDIYRISSFRQQQKYRYYFLVILASPRHFIASMMKKKRSRVKSSGSLKIRWLQITRMKPTILLSRDKSFQLHQRVRTWSCIKNINRHRETKDKMQTRLNPLFIYFLLWFIWSCLFNNNIEITKDKSMVNPSTSQMFPCYLSSNKSSKLVTGNHTSYLYTVLHKVACDAQHMRVLSQF